MPGGRPIRPRGGGGPGNRKRRVVIDGGGGRPGAGQRQRPGDRAEPRQPRTPREVVPPTGPVTVESGGPLRDFSQAPGTSLADLLNLLTNPRPMKNPTQPPPYDQVEHWAAEL